MFFRRKKNKSGYNKSIPVSFTYGSDTSTICVFDLESLAHYRNDDGDSWTIPEDEIRELNQGNLIIAGLPNDGVFNVKVSDKGEVNAKHKVVANLKCPSGKVFVGDGAHITGDDIDPTDWRDLCGVILSIESGNYQINISLNKDADITVTFMSIEGPGVNDCSKQLLLFDD